MVKEPNGHGSCEKLRGIFTRLCGMCGGSMGDMERFLKTRVGEEQLFRRSCEFLCELTSRSMDSWDSRISQPLSDLWIPHDRGLYDLENGSD